MREMRYVYGMSNTELASNWIPDTSAFGARIALVRWRMGWNLSEAERECNLTQNTWSGYESGKQPRSFIDTVNRIVLRTQVNKMWLMTGEGSPVGPAGIEPTTSTVLAAHWADILPFKTKTTQSVA